MIYWYVAFVCALIYAYLALSVLVLENGGRRWGPEKTWGGILAAPLLVDLLYLPPCSIARNVPRAAMLRSATPWRYDRPRLTPVCVDVGRVGVARRERAAVLLLICGRSSPATATRGPELSPCGGCGTLRPADRP